MQARKMADRSAAGPAYVGIVALLSMAALPACRGCSRAEGETETVRDGDDYVLQDFHCEQFHRPHSIAAAVHHEGELWAVAKNGALWSLSTSTPAITRRLEGEVPIGLKRAKSGLVVVTVVGAPRTARVRVRRSGAWSPPVELGPSATDALLADSTDDRIALVAPNEVVFVSPETFGVQARIAIAPTLPPLSRPAVLVGSALYFVSRGEERSSLVRVDVATGAWTVVERRDDASPCAGPLNASCDRLGPLIPDPSHPECVLTAFTQPPARASAERVLRVCGASVSPVLAGSEAPVFEALFAHRKEAWGLSRTEMFRAVDSGKPTQVQSLTRPTERCRFQLEPLADGVVVVGGVPVVTAPGE